MMVLTVLLVILPAGCDVSEQAPASVPEQVGTVAAPATENAPVATATHQLEAPAADPSPTSDRDPAIDPGLQELIDRAELARFEGDLELAISLWRQVTENSPDDVRILAVLELGRVYLQNDQADMAIAQASWVAALQTTPQNRAQALGLLGTAQEASGDYRGAAQSLAQYLELDDRAAPYVWWRIARDNEAIGDLTAQLEALQRIDTTRLEPSFRAEVLAKLASTYRANSDPNSALAVYDEILTFAELPEYRALVTHYKGETLREASHEDEAVAAFFEVANTEPDSFAAYLALQELVALPEVTTGEIGAAGTMTDTTAAQVLTDLTRGKIHYNAQEYNLALEYLNYYIDAEPERGEAEAHYYVGMTLAKQGDYEDALAHYNVAIENAGDQELLGNAWLAKAWTIAASGSDASGFYHEFYVNHPDHPRATEALWEAALASEKAGSWALASDYYGLLASEYPSDERAADAGFRQGLAHYAAGDPYTASTTWRTFLDATTDGDLRARLITWMGLAAKQAGQMEQADIYWQEAVRVAPDSYYGLRAADLLKHTMPRLASGLQPEVTGGELAEADWGKITAWVSSWTTGTAPVDLATDPRFLEAASLHELGWYSETRQSLQGLRSALKDEPLAIVDLARAASDWGEYATSVWCAQRLARLGREAGAADPPQALWRLAYPNLYTGLVAEYAGHYDLDPLLMLSLIRQESLFDPQARSYAGALGLAQIMPATGEWIASQIGPEDYRESLLLRPYLNLRYSAWFFELLVNLYDRDWIAALVAYNAGPGNLKAWTGGEPIQDHDLFYETLPSRQAQDYVRLVYGNYSWYRKLYRPDIVG